VRVRGEGPPPTIQSKLFFGEQEETVTDAIANPVRSMPAPRVNLPPIQRRDAESVGNQPNLAARMMPVVQRRDAESVGNQPNLAARMMPVVQRQPQPTVSIPRQQWIQRIEEQPEAKLEQEDESAPVQAKLENATVQRQSEANVEEEAEDSLPVQTKLENATVQRQSEVAQESENEDHSMQLVQPKLTVGAPGDKYEIEADSMAERVMSMNVPDAPAAIQRKEVGEEDSLQRSPLADSITPLIQRQSEEEEDIQTKPSVQQIGGDGGVQASSSIENTLASQSGSGSPLDEDVRSFMEPRFGNDFSSVRIHTGSTAVQMNKELHAQAFTHGSDVYFNEGKYNPGSNEGKQLLAHELTHVVQQTGAVQPKSATQWVKKGNKIQAKGLSAVSSEAQPAIQLKENPQQQTEKDNKVQPAKPAQAAATATESGQGGVKSQTPAAKGGTTAAKSQGQGNGGTAAAKQNATKPADSGSTSDTSAGGGGAKSLASLQDDPAFQAVVNKAKGVAQDKKKHDPAKAESKEAQDAAEPPANEVESKAQDKQVGEMNQQQPGEFNAEAFKAALMEKIAAVIPNNEEDAKKFKDSNQIDSVKQDMSSQVTQEQEQAAGPIEEKTKEAPNTSGIEPKPVTPLQPPEAGSPQTDIGAEKAAPKPKPESEVSEPLKANSQEIDQQMADAHLTEEQLKKSNEPQFQEALGAKKAAQANAVEAPKAYRQDEKATLNKAQTEAQATSQMQLQGMHGEREQLLAQVMGAQSETQGKDTQERTKIANEINGIYEKTKGEVETVLNGIDAEVTSKFDAGAATAKQKFETYVGQKMEAWEKQRYGEWYDVTGWDERVSDAWNGLPPEVNQFFVDGRQLYLNSMDVTLTGIANFVAQKLNEAKLKIASGKQKIQEYVAGLPENLKQVGQEAAQNIQEKFNQLEESVNNKQDELIDSLAQKYSENLQQIDAEIEKRKEENRGLKDKAKDAIVGTIQTIMQLKDMLMGVLAKAAGAIDKIILDPIAFLGNLISGIKQGFDKFSGNIENHLQKGLLGWLTGALAGAGITMPESFDLKGIFSLVMQVLGVVYEGIKSRVIKALGKNGEKMFAALESGFEMFVILKNEGIAGLWQFLQDKIGDLKVMVIDTIKTFVIENVIKAGVLWVVSLLNPASAFVKACKAIYDIIMFFIERGSQIAQLVNAVTDSVGAIASGAVGGAAALIENALGTSLPVVISFMASLLGLGGISEKIEGIIKTVRQPIDKAIDWLIAQAVKFAKKIGKALGFGKDEKGKDGKDNKEGKLEDSEVGKTVNFSAASESHRLWINAQGTSTTVMVASTPTPVETKLNEWQGKVDSLPEDKRPQAQSLLATARQHLGTTEQKAQTTAKEMQEAKQNSADEAAVAEAEQADNQTELTEQTLAETLQQLFECFGEGDIPTEINIEEPFSMAGEGHTLTLQEQQGQLSILMASSQQLPLTSKFQSLYTEIDDWRHFLEQYVYPKVSSDIQQQIESKLKHLKAIRQTQVSKYQKSYEDTFGNRRGDTGHQNPEREKHALKALTDMAKADITAIQEWATQTEVQDLSPEAIKNNLRRLGRQFFDQAVEDRRQRVDNILSKFQTRNGAPVKYRGSLAEGQRGPHKGGVRFNPDDFDLDLYVVDPTEHAAVLRANPALGRDDSNAPIPASRARGHILDLQEQVVQALEAAGAVPGIRVGKNYILLRKTAP
jgi:hypothetical protein